MAELLEVLQSQSEPLFALVDAGRDPEVLTLLLSHDALARSLYEGESEARLGNSGPYLVELVEQPELLRALIRNGWGNSWGLYCSSSASFDEVRKHFRTLLMVRREKDGSELYFRFYDPRVLREFLPTCSSKQVGQMFGPVTSFFTESPDDMPDDTVWRFTPQGGGVEREELPGEVAHA